VSASDVELVESTFRRLNEEGVDYVAESFHPDFEFTTPAALASEPDTYRGVEGVQRWFDSFYEAMDQVAIVPTEIVDAGPGKVAISMEVRTRGRTTGLELKQAAAMLIRISGEQVTRFEIVATLPEALALAAAEESG
jgi:ketosteroid isomerase-like protein